MLERAGTFLADVGYWIKTHRLGAFVLGGLAIVVAGVLLLLGIGPGSSFDSEAFERLQVGDAAASLEGFGQPDYTEEGETAVAMSWVEDGVQYYAITRSEIIVRSGSLPCAHKYARAC
ncbi:MAG: hypothetical protein M3383_01560 [Actinomycetota bacterium]|nr:hypothetical protein [Actinomycetota bacterium]